MALFPVTKKFISYGAGSKNVVSLDTSDAWFSGVLIVIEFVDLDKFIPDGAFFFKVSCTVRIEGISADLDKKDIGVGSCLIKAMAFQQEIAALGWFPRLFAGVAVEPVMKQWEVSFHSHRDYAGRAINAYVCPVSETALPSVLPGVYELRSRGFLPPGLGQT